MLTLDQILVKLNPSQQEAVKNIEGPSLIIAGAGSGKTRVLTHRIAYLLASGVKPYNILALTFTNKAAREMKERISEMVGEQQSKSLWMGTFHSIFYKILRSEADKIGFTSNFTIYDSTDSKNLVKKIIKEMGLDDEKYKPRDVLGAISKAKNNLITAQTYLSHAQLMENDQFHKRPETGKIYATYQARCKKGNAMDFDDLLLFTNILFRDFPGVLDTYRQKFKYVLVDEYQDTNSSQYLIVKRLSEQHTNISVVGDDAQSIYSFRGARIENILNFKSDYPKHKIYKLEQNYRSTQTIVDAANSIIKKNKSQIPKKTFSENESGEKIKVFRCSTDSEEGYRVAMNIAAKVKTEGCRYDEFAILYRTNAQSRIFEEAFNKLAIPCKIYGGISFYSRKEIKDVLSYFRFVINQSDEEAFSRIINYPARGIGESSIEKLSIISKNNELTLWETACRIEECEQVISKRICTKIASFREYIRSFIPQVTTTDAYSFAYSIVESSGIIAELREDKSVEGQGRYENIQELLNGIKEFTEREEENTIVSYLEKIALITDLDSDENKGNKVTLMTIHSAKGLEFTHCYIVGLEENLFPSQMSMGTERELEEERRLFYVALTRAEKTATLSFAITRRQWGKLINSLPSRFLSELDGSHLDLRELEKNNASSNAFQFDTVGESAPKVILPKTPVSVLNKTSNISWPQAPNEPFVADNNEAISEEMYVEHLSFGVGKVITVEGKYPDSKMIIDFQSTGRKTLLTKFAKFRIIRN